MAARFGPDWALPAFLFFTASLIAVSAIDIEHYLVPNRIVATTLIFSVPLLAAAAAIDDEWSSLWRGLLGAVLAGGGLLVLNLVYPRGMGMGDVKLALILGLFLGWLSLGHVALGMFLGFLFGAVGGVLLIALGVKSRKSHIPFAPFLAAGAYLTVLFGETFLDWYV
jgi:leader peptidase (prepilin peptidase) / N-methyltransferase